MAYYCKSNDSHNTGSTCKEALRKLHPSLNLNNKCIKESFISVKDWFHKQYASKINGKIKKKLLFTLKKKIIQ